VVPFRGHDLDRVEESYSGGGAEMATATGTFMLGGGEKRRYGDQVLVMLADTLANSHFRNHQDFH
jgi:hypothetical protein